MERDSRNPLTEAVLVRYIALGYSVLRLDHNGWPANQSASHPNPTYRADTGHAKVVARWDGNSMLLDTSDNPCPVFGHGPKCNNRGILPVNTAHGLSSSFDP
jgi:hypothetical protein